MSNLVFILLIFFLLWILFKKLIFLFKFHHSTLDWLRIEIRNFFLWWSRSHDLSHEYKMLTQIAIGLFFFFNTDFFFHPSTLGLLKIKLFYFFIFIFLSIWTTQHHDLGHEFVMITWIDSVFWHHFIFISNLIIILLTTFFSLHPFLELIIFFEFYPSILNCWELSFINSLDVVIWAP
jgi:hypothetical protein